MENQGTSLQLLLEEGHVRNNWEILLSIAIQVSSGMILLMEK